jgi:uncharacterized protein Yka (UPF0111/DUF47 family)
MPWGAHPSDCCQTSGSSYLGRLFLKRGQQAKDDVANVATKQTTIDDLVRQVSRLIGVSNSVLERYSRVSEEYDGNRLAVEEIRELIKEFVEESSRWADGLSVRIDRLERYVILVRMTGGNQQTIEVEGSVAKEHIDRALREELVNQQNIVAQYQKNIARVKMSIARYGETVPLMNELEEYERKSDKSNEAIARIRQSLAA